MSQNCTVVEVSKRGTQCCSEGTSKLLTQTNWNVKDFEAPRCLLQGLQPEWVHFHILRNLEKSRDVVK
jgi:hypothetical protein